MPLDITARRAFGAGALLSAALLSFAAVAQTKPATARGAAPCFVCAIAEKDSSAAPTSAPAPKARRAVISRGMVFRSAWWAVSMKAN